MRKLAVADVKDPAYFYRPARTDTAPQPLVVYLHGACAYPDWECPFFTGVSPSAWLLCPPAAAPCQGGGVMWAGSTSSLAQAVERGVVALDPKTRGVDLGRRALIGFSLGGPSALRIALHEPGRWQRLMIVNANVIPSPAQLTQAGIERLALVAGAMDPVAPKLRRGARWLAGKNVDVRYFVIAEMGTTTMRAAPSASTNRSLGSWRIGTGRISRRTSISRPRPVRGYISRARRTRSCPTPPLRLGGHPRSRSRPTPRSP